MLLKRLTVRIFPIAIFCLLLCLNTSAQISKEIGFPFITNYDRKSVDASAQNWSITEDKRGFMYFGNGNVLEYDGSKWEKVRFLTKGQSTTRALITDHLGQVFYGKMNDFGLFGTDSNGKTVGISLLDFVPVSKRDFADIWTVLEAKEGYYFQARERIFRFARTQEKGKSGWIIKSWEPKTKFMFAFYVDGSYYVHQRGEGVFKMVNDSLVRIPGSEFLGKERMQVMLPYATAGINKQYLFGTFFNGLFLFDGKTFRPFVTEVDSIIKNSTLYKGLMLKDGTYALATTANGLVVINAQGQKIQHINRMAGLQDESVYSLYSDKNNNLWLGLDNGISRVNLGSSISIFNNLSGVNTAVLCVVRFEGTIYIGTTDGLRRLNHSNNRFELVDGLPRTQVFSLLVDGDHLLISSDGLFSLRRNKITVTRRSISGDMQVRHLFISRKHPDLLFGSSSFGLAIFHRKTSLGEDGGGWEYTGAVPTLSDNLISSDEDSDGNIWATTGNSTAFRYILAFDEKGLLDISKINAEKFGVGRDVPGGTITGRMIKGKFYFIADTVVYRFDKIRNSLVIDNTFGAIKSLDVLQGSDLMEDYAGRVWVIAPFVTRIATMKADSSFTIGSPNLLPVADKSFSQVYPERGNIIWLCTVDGLIRYDENAVKANNKSFKCWLRGIKTGTLLINPDSALASYPVQYENNSVSFEYAAPFFDQEDKIRYQTWLEGFDPIWSDWGKNSYKEYTNLPAGKYKFHVRAYNLFQQISEPAVFTFEIRAPWYYRWWAYALLAIVLGALVWFFISVRSKRLLEENRKLEEKVTTRTSELNQSLSELKLTQAQLIQSEKMASLGELTAGIAHEIKNPLNFITNFSEVNTELLAEMIADLDNAHYEDAKILANNVIENQKKINHHGKRADSIVNTMAQHSKGGQDQKESTDLNLMADEYLMLSYHAMRAKNAGFNSGLKKDLSQNLLKVMVVPNDISRVLTNIFNNAFYSMAEKKKFKGKTYEPSISISTKQVNGMAEIEITDNGMGIPSSVLNKIYQPFFTTKPPGEGTGLGLSLSYDIIKAHGGKLEVQTTEGDCTSFKISLPLES